jgi:hypothetical protein
VTRALLIGATGMLAAAARHVAERADSVILTSRNADQFSFGDAALDGKLKRLALSYEDAPSFLDALEPYAPFDLALTWIRPRAELLRAALDAFIAPKGLLVEVMGSRSTLTGTEGQASIATLRADALAHQPDIIYAQVILGFMREKDTSRWLTHEEISAATIAQLDAPMPRRIAGVLEPWDQRPS